MFCVLVAIEATHEKRKQEKQSRGRFTARQANKRTLGGNILEITSLLKAVKGRARVGWCVRVFCLLT
jgi:hypothetical protein